MDRYARVCLRTLLADAKKYARDFSILADPVLTLGARRKSLMRSSVLTLRRTRWVYFRSRRGHFTVSFILVRPEVECAKLERSTAQLAAIISYIDIITTLICRRPPADKSLMCATHECH